MNQSKKREDSPQTPVGGKKQFSNKELTTGYQRSSKLGKKKTKTQKKKKKKKKRKRGGEGEDDVNPQCLSGTLTT